MDKVGVYCSAINPHLWLAQYENIKQNNTEIEIMYVGPNPPSFDLPPGMKYIYSTVKPAQCFYIGATRVDGNYLMRINDDMTFSPGAIDKCLELLKQNDQTKTIVGPGYNEWFNGSGNGYMDIYGTGHVYPQAPNITVSNLTTRELWNAHGIDKNFVALYWDYDQCMNVWAMGGKVLICDEARTTDEIGAGENRLSHYLNRRDLFYSWWLWMTDNSAINLGTEEEGWAGHQVFYGSKLSDDSRWDPCHTRAVPLDPIVETPDILTVSQGRKGHWS